MTKEEFTRALYNAMPDDLESEEIIAEINIGKCLGIEMAVTVDYMVLEMNLDTMNALPFSSEPEILGCMQNAMEDYLAETTNNDVSAMSMEWGINPYEDKARFYVEIINTFS